MTRWIRTIFNAVGALARPESMEDARQDAIRRVLDGEAGEDEAAFVNQRIQRDDDWRRSHQRVTAILNGLRHTSCEAPMDRIWSRIETSIETDPPKYDWSLWLDASSPARFTLRFAPSAAAILLVASAILFSPGGAAEYEIIEVSDGNGFSLEAESYIAYHDLSAESTETREGLIAYYSESLDD